MNKKYFNEKVKQLFTEHEKLIKINKLKKLMVFIIVINIQFSLPNILQFFGVMILTGELIHI